MKIKKYIVKDMHEALKLIREDLGPDAVIISNYRLPRKSLFDFFSPRMIEVTAALDDNKKTIFTKPKRLIDDSSQSAGKLLQILREFDSQGLRRGFPMGSREGPGSPYRGGGLTDGRNAEVPFDLILKNEGNCLINREIDQQWKKILTSLEIQESIVENLISGLRSAMDRPEDIYGSIDRFEVFEAYLAFIKNKITKLLEPAYRPSQQYKICTFVGPTGVGKTLTMAKLATHFKICQEKKVAIVSAFENGHRPGHHELLKYYGNLVDAPVERADSTEELIGTIKKHNEKDMIFVDTMGVNSRNTGMMLRLSNLLQSLGSSQEIFLVLSSTTKSADLLRIAADFRKVGYSKLIFTKLDETDTCGSILNVVLRMGVPVAFVSYGQNVPDDISAVNPKKLAGLLLGGVDRYVEQGLQIRV
ncbi:MAG: DEAD/DEAH box helicase family protein [Bacillota bacterium]